MYRLYRLESRIKEKFLDLHHFEKQENINK